MPVPFLLLVDCHERTAPDTFDSIVWCPPFGATGYPLSISDWTWRPNDTFSLFDEVFMAAYGDQFTVFVQ